MATLAEMRVKVAQKLELTAQGQTLTAEDADIIDDRITEKHDNLFERGKLYWAVSETPSEAVVPMVWIFTKELMGEFGVSDPVAKAEIRAEAQQAMTEIAELNASYDEGEPTKALYY